MNYPPSDLVEFVHEFSTTPTNKPQAFIKLKIITAPTLDRLETIVNGFLADPPDCCIEPYGHIQNLGHELFSVAFMLTGVRND